MSANFEDYRRERDVGTPPSESKEKVSLTIDGETVTVSAGISVLRAAAQAGINIPKLCATDSLKAFGSCRLCLVEIEGAKGLPASCTTDVREGMVVTTQNKRLADIRLTDEHNWDVVIEGMHAVMQGARGTARAAGARTRVVSTSRR